MLHREVLEILIVEPRSSHQLNLNDLVQHYYLLWLQREVSSIFITDKCAFIRVQHEEAQIVFLYYVAHLIQEADSDGKKLLKDLGIITNFIIIC